MLAARGLRETDEGLEPVSDPDQRAQSRRAARVIRRRTTVVALLLTAAVLLL